MAQTPKTCPVYCRTCGGKLVMTEKRFAGISHGDFIQTSHVEYRVTYKCERLLSFWGGLMGGHDERVYNEDCSVEY